MPLDDQWNRFPETPAPVASATSLLAFVLVSFRQAAGPTFLGLGGGLLKLPRGSHARYGCWASAG
jgi:hypothetical protein